MTPIEEIAEGYKRTSIELFKDPDNPEHLTNHLTLLVARGERNPAHLALARRAVALAPDAYVAVANLSAVLSRDGRYEEALQWQERALEIAADNEQRATALDHIGLCWHDLGDFDKALQYYAMALELKPNEREIRASIAIAKMMKGNLGEGLFEYECKYHKPKDWPIHLSGIPRWMGEDLTGKTLIVAHEQGWGDSLHFCRVIPLLKQRGPTRVIFSGPEALHGLFSDNFGDSIDAFCDEKGPFTADFYCSPISACGALRLNYADIDGLPFLRARPIALPERALLKVGLSWAGNKDFAHDSHRSITLGQLAPILETTGAAFYSLQVGRGQDEITKLGLDGFIADLGGTLKNWRATARAVMALDVVIATDSANAHIAGALGKPVLQLLPHSCCWRWMRTGTTTPWYRNTRLFRQPKPNDWGTPILQVKSALEEILNGRRGGRIQAVA